MSDTAPAARPYRVRFEFYDQQTTSVSEHCIDHEMAYTAEDAAAQVRIRHPAAKIRTVEPPSGTESRRHFQSNEATDRLRRELANAFPNVEWKVRTEDGPPPWPMVVISGTSSALRYGPIVFQLEALPPPDAIIASFRSAEKEKGSR